MATTRRVKTPAVSVYNSRDEADQAIARIAELQRSLRGMTNVAETRISRIEEEVRAKAEPINEEIQRLVMELSIYAEYNRQVLTNNGKTKTAKFMHGTFQWRFTPIAVTIKGVDDVLQRLKTLGLTQFIRPGKESVDKEAMGRERALAETIEGVTFANKEEFVITPNETRLEIPTSIKTKK